MSESSALCECNAAAFGIVSCKQQRGGLERRIGLEALLHRAVQEQIRQGEEAHALVMRHEGPDHDA